MASRIASLLIRWRWPFLVLGLAAAVGAWLPAQRLAFDRSIENMFAPDDPVLEPFRKLKRTFGGDEIALAAYDDPKLLTPAGLDRLEELSNKLSQVEGVASTFSLSNVRYLLGTRLEERLLELSAGYTIGPDRRTAGIVCVLVPLTEATVGRSVTVDQMRQLVELHDRTGVLTGEPVMVVDGFRYVEHDGRLLGTTATALLMLSIVLCFRSLRWVVVPMAVVYSALVWTQALLVMGHIHLSMVSSMLWAIVTVVGIATMMHLIVRFREARSEGLAPREALTAAATALAAPIFWALTTDAAGFASLMISEVGPVHDFGLMMMLGALVTLPAMALIAPGLSLAGRIDPDPRRAWGERGLDVGLRRITDALERRPRSIGLAVTLFCGTACLGLTRLEVETDFTKNFRRASPIVRSYEFVESRLGGAGVWDVMVPVPGGSDGAMLDRLERLQERLRTEVKVQDAAGRAVPGLTKVLSAADVVELVPFGRFLAAGRLESTLESMGGRMPIVSALYGRDPEALDQLFLRVMLRARERQPSAQKLQLIAEVRRISREEFPEAEVTGFFVLLTELIESTTRDQWRTFGVATAGIGLMMLAAFRSPRLALVALVPNALPILVVMGLMGWLGLRINMGAAMIAAVSMGLAIDSSVHYIIAFRRLRSQGLSLAEALDAVHQSVGRAITFSTLALIVGFSALVLSRFVPTIYFGVLVSLAMLGGMLGNLVVLPLLLKLVDVQRR